MYLQAKVAWNEFNLVWCERFNDVPHALYVVGQAAG